MSSGDPSSFARRIGCLLVAAAMPAAWTAAFSQVDDDVPDGLKLGPMVVAPSLTAGYTYDTNVFLLNHAYAPQPQGVETAEPAVTLSLPFRNSLLEVKDTYNWRYYEKSAGLQGVSSNVATATLNLNFSSQDSLTIDATRTSGVSETLRYDPGGEAIFSGEPYRYHHEGIKLARENYGQLGYRVAVERSVVKFDNRLQLAFFNYTGFDGEATVLVPVAADTNLSFGYLGNRYVHVDPRASADPLSGTRHENGNAVFAGIEGRLGPRETYTIRVGWESLVFTGPLGSDFHGPVGSATFSLRSGRDTSIGLTATRQPYRSYYSPNNYYLFDAVSAEVRRRLPRGGELVGRVSASALNYPDPIPTGSDGNAARRRDLNAVVDLYANVAVLDHVYFRVGVRRMTRWSEFPNGGFQGSGFFGGLVFGWL